MAQPRKGKHTNENSVFCVSGFNGSPQNLILVTPDRLDREVPIAVSSKDA